MPYYLLTSTTYGNWLPGDARGSVTSVRDARPGERPSRSRREHDKFGQPWEPPLDGLRRSALAKLKGSPVRLTRPQALVVAEQFQETCEHRGWRLFAIAIMANHFHTVVGGHNGVDPRKMLNDLKAYASRALNLRFGQPVSGKWWTRNGSRRRLPDERALRTATNYVLHKQPNPLAIWPRPNPSEAIRQEP